MIDNFLLDPLANSIAVIVLLIMLVSVIWIAISYVRGTPIGLRIPPWIIPALTLLGFGVSLYLSYIETTKSDVMCGPIGDCSSVQTSEFAYVFGILPVGILGAVGYVGILLAWIFWRFGPEQTKKIGILSLWGMAWFGVLFSIYLTFLEPFVIGATCMWCITSALLITCIFWASTNPAISAIQITGHIEEDGNWDEIHDTE
jgi:uncharacterized membrane protein